MMRGRDEHDTSTDRWQRRDWWGVTLEAPDPHVLLVFWSEILGKPIWNETESGGAVDFGEGVASLGVQKASVYEPPVWPPEPGRPGMQLHLEVEVTDLEAAVEHALELGATLADYQPQDDVRVMLDPAGHPFCLYT
jgi:catechol 2,3-dioxygenase-like lactoylglutathione lyase family enzyme